MPSLTIPSLSALITALCLGSSLYSQDAAKPAGGNPMDLDPPASVMIPPAPHLTVAQSLASFQLEAGFEITPILSEPSVVDPVSMMIDEDGRMFVVEMRGFMPDTEGNGEDAPIGRISVHEDPDATGAYRKHSVFIDNLVLPRAMNFCANGVVFSDQNALYFVPRVGSKAVGPPQLVDPAYSGNGAVEFRSSGLMLALDNWYYSGSCDKRYRLRGGHWERDASEHRGEWGMTEDDYGRLLTNNNSLAMQGEILPPSATLRNPAFKWRHKDFWFAPDNNVYPIRVNPGCNRAYIRAGGKDGGFRQEVGDDWKLLRYTAGCGPLIYRGGAFGALGNDSIFVPEPAGNLVMRYREEHLDSGTTQVTHATPGHAFLASTDERFRPVNTYVGPLGELYIVDLHKGILQHRAAITPYLKRQIHERHLEDENPSGYGRVWRVTLAASASKPAVPCPPLSALPSPELIGYLASPISWRREAAQRLLIERGGTTAVAALAALAATSDNPLARVHALWTIEGLGALTVPMLQAAGRSANARLVAETIRLAESFAGSAQDDAAGQFVAALAGGPGAHAASPEIELQAALSAGPLAVGGSASTWQLVIDIATRHGADALIRDALLSGLGGGEAEAARRLGSTANASKELLSDLATASATRQGMKPQALSRAPTPLLVQGGSELAKQPKAAALPAGQSKFLEICAGCHGPEGAGLFALGPPLAQSEWVHGQKQTAMRIVLLGLTGPITVAGKRFQTPDILPLMPGLAFNLTDAEIAAVLTYLRANFGNQADAVSADEVGSERKQLSGRGVPYTAEELSGEAAGR
jgi:mono/diheme cytochrome c family protein